MKKKIFLIGGIMILVAGLLPGCGEAGPEEIKTVSEEISRKIGETTVYATITRPERGDVHPAVVFIPGSGPTDRDWNSPLLPGTNGSARLLAEELARQGYVTLRYDKRFAGVHAEENLPMLTGKISMQSHLEEVQAAVDMLYERTDVDTTRIFVLANSEGTLHAVNYQLQAGEKKFAGHWPGPGIFGASRFLNSAGSISKSRTRSFKKNPSPGTINFEPKALPSAPV